MATVLRLARAGAKKKPIYHIVAADHRMPRDGRFLEKLGLFNPGRELIDLKLDRVEHWMGHGAVPSETVAGLIKKWKKSQTADAAS